MKKQLYICPKTKIHSLDTYEDILAASNPHLSVSEEEVDDDAVQYSKKYGTLGDDWHSTLWDD